MNSNTNIGQRIKYARGALGWSQADLARMCDIAPTQFSRYESGRAEPRPETIAKIAAALNVDPIWLAQGTGDIQGPDIPLSAPPGFPPPLEISLPSDLATEIKSKALANGVTVEMEILRRLSESLQTTHDEPPLTDNEKALEKASQRGAEVALQRLFQHTQTEQQGSLVTIENYLDYVRRIILDLDENGDPIDHSKARTPEIPGANAPKGGSKQRAPKK